MTLARARGGGILGLGLATPPMSAAIANRAESSKPSGRRRGRRLMGDLCHIPGQPFDKGDLLKI